LNILAGALEVNGALPALKALSVKFKRTPGVILELTRALVGGALPLLEHLEVTQQQANSWNDDENDQVNFAAFISLADMLERRAHVYGCGILKSFNAHDSGLVEANSATQARCLRALLPSVEFFTELPRENAFEPCFRDVQPPLLEDLSVGIKEDGGAFPSLGVLEALPACKKLEVKYCGQYYNGFDFHCGGISTGHCSFASWCWPADSTRVELEIVFAGRGLQKLRICARGLWLRKPYGDVVVFLLRNRSRGNARLGRPNPRRRASCVRVFKFERG